MIVQRALISMAALFLASSCDEVTGADDNGTSVIANEGEIVGTFNGTEQRWRVIPTRSHWRKHEGSVFAGSVSIYSVAVDDGKLPSGSALMIGFGLGQTAEPYTTSAAEITITGSDGNHSSSYYGEVELHVSSTVENDGEIKVVGAFNALMPFKKRGARLPDKSNTMTIERANFSVSLSHAR